MIWATITGNLWRAGCIAALAVAAFLFVRIEGLPLIGGGYKATIERKDAALDRAAKALRAAEGELLSCKGSIARQNEAVSAAERAGQESSRRAETALRQAQRENQRDDEAIGRIRARSVVGCKTGPEIMGADL